MSKEQNNVFNTLNAINVNENKKKKNKLDYLSWADAWAEVKKRYPSATYKVEINPQNGLPFWEHPALGLMVYTSVTIEGERIEMWLPVMDVYNHALKLEPYTIEIFGKKVTVQPATMMDINKTVMRCLAKNIAMFGLGLYIYRGEDLPDEIKEDPESAPAAPTEGKAKPKKPNAPPDPPQVILDEPKGAEACSVCGQVIVDTVYHGRRITAESIVSKSTASYGKIMCINCAEEAVSKAQSEAESRCPSFKN